MKVGICESEFVDHQMDGCAFPLNALDFSPSLHQGVKEPSALTSYDSSSNSLSPRLTNRKPVGSNEEATGKKREAFAENATCNSAPESGPHAVAVAAIRTRVPHVTSLFASFAIWAQGTFTKRWTFPQ